MESKELLKPRFEVIADYPNSIFKIGDILELKQNTKSKIFYNRNFLGESYFIKKDLEKYPHLFKKINWWEHRKIEDMPKKIKSLSSKDNTDFDIEKEEVFNIIEWDMKNLYGIINMEKKQVCDLEIFHPEYGYIPVD